MLVVCLCTFNREEIWHKYKLHIFSFHSNQTIYSASKFQNLCNSTDTSWCFKQRCPKLKSALIEQSNYQKKSPN